MQPRQSAISSVPLGCFELQYVSYVIVAILDVMVAWSLYVVLKPVNKSLSLLAAWFRLAYAAIFAFAVASLLNLLWLEQNGYGPSARAGDAFTGFVPRRMGYCAGHFRRSLVPRWLPGSQIRYFPNFLASYCSIASLGYLVDSFGKILVPDYGISISSFTFIGEVLLIVWLFMRGFGKKDNLAP